MNNNEIKKYAKTKRKSNKENPIVKIFILLCFEFRYYKGFKYRIVSYIYIIF